MQVTDEMVEAGLRITLSSVNLPAGECMHETDVQEILSAALSAIVEEQQVAALAVQTQQGVEVKPLEWEYMCLNGVKAAGGMYTLHDMDGNGKRIRAMFLGDDSYRWFVSIEHAKAAAQSDYETRIRSALVDVPAVESEPVGETSEMPGSNGGFTMAAFKAVDVPIGTKLYAHPPRSLSNEGSEVIAAAQRYVDSVSHDPGARASDKAWRAHDKEKQDAFDALRAALSTRKGSSEGDGSATSTKGGGGG